MGKTITIDDDAYKLLSSLKEGPGDSFSKVIKRQIYQPIENFGELMEALEKMPPPNVDMDVLEVVRKGRGRPSNRRK